MKPRKTKQPGTAIVKKSAPVIAIAAPAPPEDKITLGEDGALRIPQTSFDAIGKVFGGEVNARGGFNDRTAVLLGQVALALPIAKGNGKSPEALNFAIDAVGSLEPKDGLEVLLCSQLIAVHCQGLDYLRRATQPDQTSEGVDLNVNRATRLLRTFAILTESLRAKRTAGRQRIVVKHVTVNSGGQAIVGSISRGGGNEKQNHE